MCIGSTIGGAGLGQVRDPPELFCWHAFGERVQNVRLHAADADGHERADVAVAAVLAEQVGPCHSRAIGSVGKGPPSVGALVPG